MQNWLSSSQTGELAEPPAANSYNSRIPILVATTTNTPKRVPITTPRPTTTTSTTSTSSSTSTEETVTSDLSEQQEEEELKEEVKVFVDESNEVMTAVTEGEEKEKETVSSPPSAPLENIPPASLAEYCGPTTARSLGWAATRAGQVREIVKYFPEKYLSLNICRW